MNNRLAVSAQCPCCGAHLEFVEGSNAVRCEYCRSRLLLTGRQRILAFSLPPAVEEQQAVEVLKENLMAGPGPRRVVRAQRCFFPYYRMTGHDFAWQYRSLRVPRNLREVEDPSDPLFPDPDLPSPPRAGGPDQGVEILEYESPRELEFQERYLEKNFLALDIPGLGIYSLGVRPAVMKLQLYDREALQGLGKILYFQPDPESATRRGLEYSRQHEVRRREVLARVLSVIFFPYWVIETVHREESWISIIDGISGAMIRLDLPLEALDCLQDPRIPEVDTVGFLPMACPNCGWELTGHADAVIFACDTCNRAWLLEAGRLSPVACRIALLPAAPGERFKYLPFWVFDGEGAADAGRLFVPAFRCRRLKTLVDTARQMFRKQPGFELGEPLRVDLEGCCYDSRDARLLAEFMLMGLPDPLRMRAPAVSTAHAPQLVWFPFRRQGKGWGNPITGTVIEDARLD